MSNLKKHFFHTHSMERYLLGLGIFALISEIPYDLAFGNSINFLEQTNIFYTLFLSAACVYMCFSLLSILFVCLYNGQHGSKKKWIYYWAYPLHILIFAILRC